MQVTLNLSFLSTFICSYNILKHAMTPRKNTIIKKENVLAPSSAVSEIPVAKGECSILWQYSERSY